jgi:predicted nucleic acid-binding protein
MVVNLTLQGKLKACYNMRILSEYREVMTRERLAFDIERVNWLLETIISTGIGVTPNPSILPMPDESDRKFYDVAKYSSAYLITGNLKHYPEESFVVTPAAFLNNHYKG